MMLLQTAMPPRFPLSAIAMAQANRVRRRPMGAKLRNQLELPRGVARNAPTFYAERAMAQLYGAPVAGIDEAGRGPWAGPVVAAAVILDSGRRAPAGLHDSKQLTEGEREVLFGAVTAQALAYGIGVATVEEIDRINIRQATHLAMRRAYEALVPSGVTPSAVLVDGDDAPAFEVPTRALIDGDARSLGVAAASILAKVTRDRMMAELDAHHPGYGFARHKGYGTRQHAAALLSLGCCACHRASFSPIALALEAKKQLILDLPLMEA